MSKEILIDEDFFGVGDGFLNVAAGFVIPLLYLFFPGDFYLALLHPGDPARGFTFGPFPEEEDIGHHFGAGVGLESGLGEPDGAYEIGPVGQVFPGLVTPPCPWYSGW